MVIFMKRRMLSVLAAICMILALLPSTAGALEYYPVKGGSLTFDPDTGTITDCDESVTEADIPDEIGGIPVTGIGKWAFLDCDSLTRVTIPTGVTIIGKDAFWSCDSLSSVTIPASVTTIGEGAFSSCDSLPNINVADGNINYISEDGVLFNAEQTLLHTYPGGKSGVYRIPDTVTIIKSQAFYSCGKLTGVTIPYSVTTIGGRAFEDCTGLEGVTIPENVISIGYGAFDRCTGLKSVTIPDRITELEYDLFAYCKNLRSVIIPVSVTTIGSGAFRRCDNLKDVYYSGSESQWKEISIETNNDPLLNAKLHYESAELDFSDATGLCGDNLTWTFEDGTLTIQGTGPMFDYNNEELPPWYNYRDEMENVIITAGVTGIGTYAFSNCGNLTGVTIPASVTTIEKSAFSACTGLTDVYYSGNKGLWKEISIKTDNDPLLNATIHRSSDIITVTFNANGGNVNPVTANPETDGTLSSLPKPTRDGYNFDGWYTAAEGGTQITTETVFTIDTTVYAHWAKIESSLDTYTITLDSRPVEGGSVTGGGTYKKGQSVTVRASSASGYQFVSWTENGKQVSSKAAYTFAVEADRALTAEFEKTSSSISGVGSNSSGSSGGRSKPSIKPGGTSAATSSPTAPAPTSPIVPTAQSRFTDVPANSYYSDAVTWAVENGITSGRGGKNSSRTQLVPGLRS